MGSAHGDSADKESAHNLHCCFALFLSGLVLLGFGLVWYLTFLSVTEPAPGRGCTRWRRLPPPGRSLPWRMHHMSHLILSTSVGYWQP